MKKVSAVQLFSMVITSVGLAFFLIVLARGVSQAKAETTPEVDACVLVKHLAYAVNIGQEKDLSDIESYHVRRDLWIVDAYCTDRVVIEVAGDLPYQLTVDTGEGEGFLPTLHTLSNTGTFFIYVNGEKKIDLSGVLDSGDLVSLENSDHLLDKYFYYDPDTKIGVSILTIGGEYKINE